MADANPKVMEMIEAELKKNPDISNKELFDKAIQIDKGISKLSARQFNAMYPLQVKRALKPRKRGGRKSKASRAKGGKRAGRTAGASGSAGDSRGKVRAVLLDLARDVANAQGKGDVVDVVAGIDRYVDRAIKAAS